jgi:hypothetical protein
LKSFNAPQEPALGRRIHLCGADIHSTFTSFPLVFNLRCGEAAEQVAARRWDVTH